jgi:hypothetical protein
MSGKKIKIALCLSGEPRSSMASFPYIYENLLINNNVFKTDVYIYSLKGFRALDIYKPKRYLIENLNITQLQKSATEFFEIHSSKLSQNNTYEGFSPNSNTLVNNLLMFKGIQECFNLIKEPYDIYIRARYDIMFRSKFFLEHTIEDIIMGKYDMFIPHQYANRKIPEEYNDQFAVGNYKSFSIYSQIINQIHNLLEKSDSLNSQIWIKHWLDQNKIKINQSYIDMRLIRQCNITTNDETFNFLDQ